MEQKKCKKCDMPLDKPEDKCSCADDLCVYCCECEEECNCGCKKK
ncbi:MAG: hypothetical protein WC242_03810 [Candidatus Paceibacterota bacterium]